ncbi:unnamed protein product [Didymodactylos carnosus]|uniref:Antistasin-like domain-containing protein n=1 Tax=Didymodactylos carnosus TaxID=1234261 RepID=A0A813VDP6_9BILA|nr:unnamed protein product [Didymodactylos carnosus]CAF0917405.1 unnamed protein product [Didymodactylos carnosus]CAF3631334.1 unnamed protein product [Didymodactylos carnosus]CAF3695446.1 unnamed protein product [Didymodactylos carnosus]
MLLLLFIFIGYVFTQPPFGPNPNCRPLSNCNLDCTFRYKLDSNGCEICSCRTTPCINETAIIPNAECDRTPNGPKCPSTHDCVGPFNGPPTPGSTQSPTARGVCCIHIDFEALGLRPPGPRPPPQP